MINQVNPGSTPDEGKVPKTTSPNNGATKNGQSQNSQISDIYNTKSYSSYETDMDKKTGVEGPLAFWILVMFIGILLIILSISFITSFSSILYKVGYYIIYLPGDYVLPLLVGIWIGVRSERSLASKSIKSALVNSVYASFVYAIAMAIIYLILYYTSNFTSLITFNVIAENVIAIPIIIVIVISSIISVLKSAKRKL